MKATYKVVDSQGKVTGFLVDQAYHPYHEIVQNIHLIDNLALYMGRVVFSTEEPLPLCRLREVNQKKGLITEAYVAEITRGGIGRTVRTIPIYTVDCRFPYEEVSPS